MFAAMRYIILFFICLSAIGAETTNKLSSLDSFAKQIRTSYEKKDGAWMLQSSYTNGVPAEILAANEKMFRWRRTARKRCSQVCSLAQRRQPAWAILRHSSGRWR